MDLLLEILLHPVVIAIIKIMVIVLMFVMATGTVLTLMERKWMSAVQDRIGPNRANIPFHPAARYAASGVSCRDVPNHRGLVAKMTRHGNVHGAIQANASS